jgi:hypothetical protein
MWALTFLDSRLEAAGMTEGCGNYNIVGFCHFAKLSLYVKHL